jgi:hypothetical protein
MPCAPPSVSAVRVMRLTTLANHVFSPVKGGGGELGIDPGDVLPPMRRS